MNADKPQNDGQHEHWGTSAFEAIERAKAEHVARIAQGDLTPPPPITLPEPPSLEILLKRIVDASTEFNDEVFYHHGKTGTAFADAANRRLAKLYCTQVRYGGLAEIKKVLAEIAPPIEAEDGERLAKSPIKSQDAGDIIKEDPIYRVLTAAVAWLTLIKSGKPEGNGLRAHKAFRVYLNEIMRLPESAKDDPTAWGRVITEVIWHRRAEEIFHVEKVDLEPGGEVYALIITEAEAACRERKLKRNETFQRRCGVDYTAFLALDDAGRIKVLEDHSRTPEEKDKAAAHASRLLEDAREIEAMVVTDGDLKEALRDRLVERLGRMFR